MTHAAADVKEFAHSLSDESMITTPAALVVTSVERQKAMVLVAVIRVWVDAIVQEEYRCPPRLDWSDADFRFRTLVAPARR